MAIRATASKNYLMRLGLVGLFCLAGTLWFFYDGYIGWPALRAQGLEYVKFLWDHADQEALAETQAWVSNISRDWPDEKTIPEGSTEPLGQYDLRAELIKLLEEHQKKDLNEIREDWKKYAASKGWPEGVPLDKDTNEPKKIYAINGQYIWVCVAGLAALGFLSRLGYMLGRWVESDDEGLQNKAGQQAKYSDITQLDKKRWQSKGIAFVHYQSGGGAGKIRLDDFYYDRPNTKAIVRQVEAHIDPTKIANGKPEPPEQPADNEQVK
jgi:hypothetical protein